jgi:hypothetical protein
MYIAGTIYTIGYPKESIPMNSIEEYRDYVIADMISHIQSMSREELIQALITACTPPLEEMDAKQLFNFRGRYSELWKKT